MRLRGLSVLLALVCAVAVVLFSSLSAWAGLSHQFVSSFGPEGAGSSFANVQSIAVDEAAGVVYVYDQTAEKIYKFNAAGAPVAFTALAADAISGVAGVGGRNGVGEDQLAVDNSAGPAKGDIYFAHGGSVRIFAADGSELGELNSGVEGVGGPWAESCGVAVDSSGNVYVGLFREHVDRFTPLVNPVSNADFSGSLSVGGSNAGICNIAADSAGDVFAGPTWRSGPAARFEASLFGMPAGPETAGVEFAPVANAVAVEAGTDDVYVDDGAVVSQYDSSGALLGRVGEGANAFSESFGVAADAAVGRLYVSDNGQGRVDVFGPAVFSPPAVAAEYFEGVEVSSATLRAQVNPEGFPATYRFEYGTDTGYGASSPVPDGSVGSDATVHGVSQALEGLQPGTVYHFRIAVSSANGTSYGPDKVFKTQSASCPNAQTRAQQSSEFLPDCRAYEMVSPADKNGGDVLSSSGHTRAAADGSAVSFASLIGFGDSHGTGIAAEYMSVRSSEPDPGTSGWATHGITPRQEALPFVLALRAEPTYEGEFSSDLSRGMFLSFTPLTGNSGLTSELKLYLRSDLRTPGAGSYTLLSGCPLCEATGTPLPLPPQPLYFFPAVAGASADLTHVLFESGANLTADASGEEVKLYESDHGVVRLAGILPDGTPAPVSQAGEHAGGNAGTPRYTPHVISADGSRVIFTVPLASDSSEGALYMRVDHASTVQLNASERTDCGIVVSGELPKAPPACTGAPALDPNGVQPAIYWNASVDGSRVFFTTTQALTDDAPVNGNGKLFMYDTTRPAGQRLTFIGRGPVGVEVSGSSDGDGVLGVSDDGRYVYFSAHGQLVAGQPTVGKGLYVWHDDGSPNGVVSYIGNGERMSLGFSPLVNEGSTDWVSRVTPDGRHLLFATESGEGLLSRNGGGEKDYDQSGCGGSCTELYVYSADSARLQCVSCNPSGVPATASASALGIATGGAYKRTRHLNRMISDDGRWVFFQTDEALVPRDVNGVSDVYEFDTSTGVVSLISSGRDSAPSFVLDSSASGSDVFFATREGLVGWDGDQALDVYDARVGGGFPEPRAAAASCSGDGCPGATGGAPGSLVAGSALVSSGGNLAAPVVRPAVRGVSRARRLAAALRVCRRKHGRQRRRCEAHARAQYSKKAFKSGRGK